MRTPSASNIDLRFNKDFSVWKLDCSFIVWVTNLFNTESIDQIYGNTGRVDTAESEYTSRLWNYDIFDYVVSPGTEYDKDPYNYGATRNIRLGLSVNF